VFFLYSSAARIHNMKIIVTGAGFIGQIMASRLSVRGDEVVGVGIVNDYKESECIIYWS